MHDARNGETERRNETEKRCLSRGKEISYSEFVGALLQTRMHMREDLMREASDDG